MGHPKLAAYLRRDRQQAGDPVSPAIPAKQQHIEKAKPEKGEGYKRKSKED